MAKSPNLYRKTHLRSHSLSNLRKDRSTHKNQLKKWTLIRKLAAYHTGATIVQKRDRGECEYHKIGEWMPQTYKNGAAEIAIDLVSYCKDATQYEIGIQPREEGKVIKVKDISLRYEGLELRQFV